LARQRISNTLRRLSRRLFDAEAEQAQFIESLIDPPERPTAVIWVHGRPAVNPFPPLPRVSWQPEHVDLVSIAYRPGQHAVHEAGDVYCLDPSSVFTSQVLSEITEARVIVDLCASPGGKSILAWRRFHPESLICNEVVSKRRRALISNLRRCRIHPAVVVQRDSQDLAEEFSPPADLVIVDAPCSGQSLIARGKPSPGCFHPATINMNANRQRRILSSAVRLVRPGGYLAYITCTFSIKENERNVDWLLKKQPQLRAVSVSTLQDYQSEYTETPCYRLWPSDPVGAGGFAVLLRSMEESSQCVSSNPHRTTLPVVWESTRQPD